MGVTGVVAGVVLCSPFAASAQPVSCDGRDRVSPDELVACLAAGPVDLVGTTVTGALDLSSVDVVPHPFRCVECTFAGDVTVTDVTFDRLVALERVTIEGDLDARGARFAGAVLARGQREGDPPSGVRGDADFSLARFDQAVQLDATTFDGAVSFEGARFDGSVSMSGTQLGGPANFDRIVAAETFALDGPNPMDASAPNGVANGVVTLRGAAFDGDLDLGARQFRRRPGRNGCSCGRAADAAQRRRQRRRRLRAGDGDRPRRHRAGGHRSADGVLAARQQCRQWHARPVRPARRDDHPGAGDRRRTRPAGRPGRRARQRRRGCS